MAVLDGMLAAGGFFLWSAGEKVWGACPVAPVGLTLSPSSSPSSITNATFFFPLSE